MPNLRSDFCRTVQKVPALVVYSGTRTKEDNRKMKPFVGTMVALLFTGCYLAGPGEYNEAAGFFSDPYGVTDADDGGEDTDADNDAPDYEDGEWPGIFDTDLYDTDGDGCADGVKGTWVLTQELFPQGDLPSDTDPGELERLFFTDHRNLGRPQEGEYTHMFGNVAIEWGQYYLAPVADLDLPVSTEASLAIVFSAERIMEGGVTSRHLTQIPFLRTEDCGTLILEYYSPTRIDAWYSRQ